MRMTIYIVNNNGEWLRRHQEASHVKDTDWWISPNTTTFRKALAGDLFFITKTGSRELSAVATLKHNYTTEVPETAWQYASPAYASAFTPRSRAAAVLKIPEDDISASSRVGLLVLTGLQWFDNSERPSVPDSYSKFIVTGKPYLPTDDDYDYLYDLSVNVLNYSVDSDAVRDTFARFTHAQIAEIIPRHRHLADRFAKWLHRNGYTSVLKEHGRVDIRFRIGSQRLMAELKICYQTDTLHGWTVAGIQPLFRPDTSRRVVDRVRPDSD